MSETGNRDNNLRESRGLLGDSDLLELDAMLLKANEELTRKAGEIGKILVERDSKVQQLRRAYLAAVAVLKEKEEALARKAGALDQSTREFSELKSCYNLLRQDFQKLEQNRDALASDLACANQQKNDKQEQIGKLEADLDRKEEERQTLVSNYIQAQKDYNQYYTDFNNEKDRVKSELKQVQDELERERKSAESLQMRLDTEMDEKAAIEKAMQDLDSRVGGLDEKVQRYEARERKMPAVMRLYDAYNGMMERRAALPGEFFERLQNVVPPDDFDGFLSRALRRSFPISFHLSIQSFIAVCNNSGQVPGEAVKEALSVSDDLLSAVFEFGSAYFKEEKIVRIDCRAGDEFKNHLCKYIDGNGGSYGNIVRVWLQGFRDERDNVVYCSYVEGE